MVRYYGVIKDIDTAKLFSGHLFMAVSGATQKADGKYTSGLQPIGSVNSLISAVSSKVPSFLSETLEGAGASFIESVNQQIGDAFTATGQVLPTSEEEQDIALSTDARGRYGPTTKDANGDYINEVIRISDDIMLIVQPKIEVAPPSQQGDCPCFTDGALLASFIAVRQIYRVTVDGSERTEYSDTLLRQTNDNNFAPYLAYEITRTESGDVLVKIAGSAIETEPVASDFVGLSIKSYGPTRGGVITTMTTHTANYFGAAATYGGFVLHAMKNGDATVGLTLFRPEGNPLFTFIDGAPNIQERVTGDNGNDVFPNTNSAINRVVEERLRQEAKDGEKTDTRNSNSIIKMGVLAPIFSPGSGTAIAKYAKWMIQGPHDYSYFDRTGHIYIAGNYYFVDYGICLHDGSNGKKYTNAQGFLPGTIVHSMPNYIRPEPDIWIPYRNGLDLYFDSKAGLTEDSWKNCMGEKDMIFSGSPSINADGSVRFAISSTPSYGYIPDAPVLSDFDSKGFVTYFAYKLTNLTESQGSDFSEWIPMISLSKPAGLVINENQGKNMPGELWGIFAHRSYNHYGSNDCRAKVLNGGADYYSSGKTWVNDVTYRYSVYDEYIVGATAWLPWRNEAYRWIYGDGVSAQRFNDGTMLGVSASAWARPPYGTSGCTWCFGGIKSDAGDMSGNAAIYYKTGNSYPTIRDLNGYSANLDMLFFATGKCPLNSEGTVDYDNVTDQITANVNAIAERFGLTNT